jgi:hypothetical protein
LLRLQAWNLQLQLERKSKELAFQRGQNQDLKDLYEQSQLEAREAQRMVEIILQFSTKVQSRTAYLSQREELQQRDSRIAELEMKLQSLQPLLADDSFKDLAEVPIKPSHRSVDYTLSFSSDFQRVMNDANPISWQ